MNHPHRCCYLRIASLLTCSLLVAFTAPTFAESLSFLIREGLQHNAALQAAQQQWQASTTRIRAARGLDDPMIGVTAERDNTRFNDYMDLAYMVSQQFPAWGTRSARVAAATHQAEAEGLRFLDAGRALRATITESAWNLWLADRRLETTREIAQLADRLTDSVRARYEAGQAMSADLVRAQIEQARLNNEAVTFQREREIALATLNAQINADSSTPRLLDDLEAVETGLPPLSELMARAKESNCAVLAMERETEARQAMAQANRRERRPAIQINVEARQREGDSGIHAFDTGVAMNLPWIWGGKYNATIAGAEAERQLAAAALQDAQRASEQQITERHAQAENAQRTADVLKTTIVPLARQAVEQTQAAYTAGTGGLLDRIEAQRTLLESELDLHTAVAAGGIARARLDQLTAPFGDWEQSTGALPEHTSR